MSIIKRVLHSEKTLIELFSEKRFWSKKSPRFWDLSILLAKSDTRLENYFRVHLHNIYFIYVQYPSRWEDGPPLNEVSPVLIEFHDKKEKMDVYASLCKEKGIFSPWNV